MTILVVHIIHKLLKFWAVLVFKLNFLCTFRFDFCHQGLNRILYSGRWWFRKNRFLWSPDHNSKNAKISICCSCTSCIATVKFILVRISYIKVSIESFLSKVFFCRHIAFLVLGTLMVTRFKKMLWVWNYVLFETQFSLLLRDGFSEPRIQPVASHSWKSTPIRS